MPYREISCIYELYFLDTDWFYIGSTYNYGERIARHLRYLNNQTHTNTILQNVFNKYPEKLQSRIIQTCSVKNLQEIEQDYLDTFQPTLNIKKKTGGGSESLYKNIYELSDPKQVIWATHSLNDLSKQLNLNCRHLYSCSKGELGGYKGWRVLSINGKQINGKKN